MLAFQDREIVKLLAIGGRKEAADVDKKNYGQVIKFVEDSFDISLKKLKDQNKEFDARNKRREEIEAEIERRRKLHDEEMAKKQRNATKLRRTPSEPETKIHIESKIDIDAVKSSQIAAESQQIVVVENQLKRAKDKNDEALKQLNDLTDQINDKDDRLNGKRKELDDLKEKFDRRKADEDRNADRLELEIAELTREIERLGNELDNAKKLPRAEPSEQVEQVPRKDGELDEQLRRAEADRAELLNQLNKLQDEYRNACDELKRGKDRHREIENQLQDVLNDIGDIQRKLNRRKDSAPQSEYDVSHAMAQPLQFQHTTVTRIEGAGGSRTEQIVSGSQLRGPQKSPTSSAKDKDKDGDKRSSPSTQFGTQASVSDPQPGSGSAGVQPGGIGYDEQIRSLQERERVREQEQESKRFADSRRDSLQRKVEKARPKSQSPSTEGTSGSSQKSKPSKPRRSHSSSRSSKGPGSSAASEIRSEQAPISVSSTRSCPVNMAEKAYGVCPAAVVRSLMLHKSENARLHALRHASYPPKKSAQTRMRRKNIQPRFTIGSGPDAELSKELAELTSIKEVCNCKSCSLATSRSAESLTDSNGLMNDASLPLPQENEIPVIQKRSVVEDKPNEQRAFAVRSTTKDDLHVVKRASRAKDEDSKRRYTMDEKAIRSKKPTYNIRPSTEMAFADEESPQFSQKGNVREQSPVPVARDASVEVLMSGDDDDRHLTLTEIHDLCLMQSIATCPPSSSASSAEDIDSGQANTAGADLRSKQPSGGGGGVASTVATTSCLTAATVVGNSSAPCGKSRHASSSGGNGGCATTNFDSGFSDASNNTAPCGVSSIDDGTSRAGDSNAENLFADVLEYANDRDTGVRASLPPPNEFGDGNPFMLFVCLTLLLQHRDAITKKRMDFNEIAIHFDKLMKKHNVRKVLKRARVLFADYLKGFHSDGRTHVLH